MISLIVALEALPTFFWRLTPSLFSAVMGFSVPTISGEMKSCTQSFMNAADSTPSLTFSKKSGHGLQRQDIKESIVLDEAAVGKERPTASSGRVLLQR